MYNDDINYYMGYLLDDGLCNFELTDDDRKLLDACIWMIDNKASIRCTAANQCMNKSTLHKHIHTKLNKLSYELYTYVIRVLAGHTRR